MFPDASLLASGVVSFLLIMAKNDIRIKFVLTKLIVNLNECFYCKNMFDKPQNPLMSDLSKEQFAIIVKVFSKTGIDCFGATYVKTCKKTC